MIDIFEIFHIFRKLIKQKRIKEVRQHIRPICRKFFQPYRKYYNRRNHRGRDEETEASGIFVITGRGKAIQWRVTRKLLGSICEINEFHNALTTFTVKTKSRLRG